MSNEWGSAGRIVEAGRSCAPALPVNRPTRAARPPRFAQNRLCHSSRTPPALPRRKRKVPRYGLNRLGARPPRRRPGPYEATERRRRCPEGGSMKRILYGLGCSMVLVPGALVAQDSGPAATLGRPFAPTVRAQAPEFASAAGFDAPKVMPKGKSTDV